MSKEVKLRALEPEDLELVYQIENDPELWSWGGDSQPYSRFTLRQYLQQQQSDIYQDGQLRLVITLDDVPVGIADLTSFSPHHLRAEVGIVILPSLHRQGIASCALQQLAKFAQQHLHLHCLYAYVATSNLPAQALFHSLGYTEVGSIPLWIEGRETAILFHLSL
jgi:diamine N-acetyltransferase